MPLSVEEQRAWDALHARIDAIEEKIGLRQAPEPAPTPNTDAERKAVEDVRTALGRDLTPDETTAIVVNYRKNHPASDVPPIGFGMNRV